MKQKIRKPEDRFGASVGESRFRHRPFAPPAFSTPEPEAGPADLDARIDSARRFGHDVFRLPPSREPAVPMSPVAPASGVIQRMRGPYSQRKRSRHRVIRSHLERAQKRTNASEVSLIVFHNGERVFSTPALRKSKADEPSTSLVHARHGQDHKSLSKDGELFLVDQLNSFLPQYVSGIKESYDQSGHYQTYPSFDVSKRQQRHEIRIEMIGPKGTCEDCQEALSRYLQELKARHGQTYLGAEIGYTLNTRWTGAQTESPRGRVLSGRLGKGMSSIYGSGVAKKKRGLGTKLRQRYAPEHFKLRIQPSNRRTHLNFRRPVKRPPLRNRTNAQPRPGQHKFFDK